MVRDIEEFLKKAAARRQQQLAGRPEPPPQATPPITTRPQRTVGPPPREPVRPIPPIDPPDLTTDVMIIEDEDTVQPQVVGRHVETHIDTTRVAGKAEQLGQRISRAPEQLQDRIQRRFTHDVGHLELAHEVSTEVSSAGPREPAALSPQSIVDLLRSPATIRQTILLTEILKRPDFGP